MTELAFLLHWSAGDMERMPVGELFEWRSRAVQLHNKLHEAPE